jgi:hypothetical protein
MPDPIGKPPARRPHHIRIDNNSYVINMLFFLITMRALS